MNNCPSFYVSKKTKTVKYLIFRNDPFYGSGIQFHFPFSPQNMQAFKNTTKLPIFISSSCKTTINWDKTYNQEKPVFSSELTIRPAKSNYLFIGELYIWQIREELCEKKREKGDYYVTLSNLPVPHWYK